ncbi:hypothetical protein I4U23_025334 [Adineta vaga]|nr:hypothetical protein I4U23_025334 [Adineta vaga]
MLNIAEKIEGVDVVIKAIELTINQTEWSLYDDPLTKELKNKLQQYIKLVQENIEKDFPQWTIPNILLILFEGVTSN